MEQGQSCPSSKSARPPRHADRHVRQQVQQVSSLRQQRWRHHHLGPLIVLDHQEVDRPPYSTDQPAQVCNDTQLRQIVIQEPQGSRQTFFAVPSDGI